MSDDGPPPKKQEAGAPMWIVTFSDLMSLLLCFFVLLLSFSTMDKPKFKKVSGSLKEAFGIQRKIIDEHIPKGTSIIAREFSPGRPTINKIEPIFQTLPPLSTPSEEDEKKEEEAEKVKKALSQTLDDEVKAKEVEVVRKGADVIIRINETASFDSGSAQMNRRFAPTLLKIVRSLKKVNGTFTVAGHTDDVPIASRRFRSNWELSTSRAVTVAHMVMKVGKFDSKRFVVRGHAETKPVVPNDSPANRAKNRRVEFIVGVGKAVEQTLSVTNDANVRAPASNGNPLSDQ